VTRQRRPVRYAELTSLIDVMFILLFAATIHASATGEPSAPAARIAARGASSHTGTGTARPGATRLAPDASAIAAPRSRDFDADRERALSELARGLTVRPVVVARVSPEGAVVAIEHSVGGRVEHLSLAIPLVARVSDPDIVLSYLGDRSRELRVCGIVAMTLHRERFNDEIIAIVPDIPIEQMTVALARGLARDAEHCFADAHALGVLVGQPAVPPPHEEIRDE